MATIYTTLTLLMYWKGYHIDKPRNFLRHQIFRSVTEQGRMRGINWEDPIPSAMIFHEQPKYPIQIIEKFLEIFDQEIFVDDSCDVRIRNQPGIEAVISHELYTPVACIHSPLTPSEFGGALKHFLNAVNSNRIFTKTAP